MRSLVLKLLLCKAFVINVMKHKEKRLLLGHVLINFDEKKLCSRKTKKVLQRMTPVTTLRVAIHFLSLVAVTPAWYVQAFHEIKPLFSESKKDLQYESKLDMYMYHWFCQICKN